MRAYLKTLEIIGNVQENYTWKKEFLFELYRRGMARETLLAIYKFIDWIIELPDALERKIHTEIKKFEEKKAMSILTTAERIGAKKGRRDERKRSVAMAQKAIATILKLKFGDKSKVLTARINQVKSLSVLENLMERLPQAQTVTEAEEFFKQVESQTTRK
ncbi:MAG: hypothetical protein ACE5I1_16670 [bacterium]